jgi:hypothetical protein
MTAAAGKANTLAPTIRKPIPSAFLRPVLPRVLVMAITSSQKNVRCVQVSGVGVSN